MTFWLAYNPALGNALVGINETDFDVPEGITKTMYDGDMPDMDDWFWNTATLQLVQKTSGAITRLEYMNRFTDAELATIYTVAKSNVQVEVWLEKFKAATSIDLTDPRTIAGVQALEAVGIIGAGRAAEILA